MSEHNFRFDIQDFIDHRSSQEFTFDLPASSIGRKSRFKARCRRINMMDRATIGFLPTHLQNEVWTQLRSAANEIRKLQESGAEAKDVNEALANNDKMVRIGSLLMRYAFIEPKIVLNPSEEDLANGVLHVDRIAAEDRVAVMIACNDATSEQAGLFSTFRERPADAVSDRQGGEVVPDATQRPAGDPAPPLPAGAPAAR